VVGGFEYVDEVAEGRQGLTSRLGVVVNKKFVCYEMSQLVLEFGFLLARSKQREKDVGFGTWNVRSL